VTPLKFKHSYVTLIDLPEALPFVTRKKKEIKFILDAGEEDIKKLFEFIKILEKEFGEEFSFIGEDIIAEKFYRRFLFPKGGFLEVMSEPPAAIIAHFIDEARAKRFAIALKKAIQKVVSDKTAANILQNSVEVSTEKEDALTYKKWSELKDIRKMVE
jgi:hypothetical protein